MSDHPNFNEAVRLHGDRRLLAFEQRLVCVHCGARNTAGCTVVELEAANLARCGCCTKTFDPQEQEQP